MPQNNVFGLANQFADWVSRVNAAAQDAPLTVGGPLTKAVSAVVDALGAITTAKTDALAQRSEANRPEKYNVTQAAAVLTQASDKATAAINALETEVADARATLERTFRPKQPSGASDALVIDRKGDLQRIIIHECGEQPHPVELTNYLGKLLAEAYNAGNTLSAYVLAGGPMDLFYRSLGGDLEAIAAKFAAVKADQTADKPAGQVLYALIARGGPGSLAALVTMARAIVTLELADTVAAYKRLAAAIGA